MEIVRTFDKPEVIEIMRQRGYGLVSESKSESNGETLNFAKTVDLGVCLHASVYMKPRMMSLEMVQLKYFAQINMSRFDFFHKDFERIEKILYLYSRGCLDLDAHIFRLADNMRPIQNKLPGFKEDPKEKEEKKAPPTIKERKSELWDKIRQVGKDKSYEKDMCMEFFNYWVEMNEGGKKMRFEFERVFDVSRRLSTWLDNDKKWLKQYKSKEEVKADKQEEKLKKDTTVIDKTKVF
jgi:hypothetical protein